MKHVLTLLAGLLFIGDNILNISFDVWAAAFMGFGAFALLQIEYAVAKCKNTGTTFSWKKLIADNGVYAGIAFLIIAPSVYVFNSVEVLTPLTAFGLGYFNIHALRALVKRTKYLANDTNA